MKTIFLSIILLTFGTSMYSQEVIPLYPSGIPNSKPGKDEEVTTIRDAKHIGISKISRPTLTVFLAPASIANGTAVVVLSRWRICKQCCRS